MATPRTYHGHSATIHYEASVTIRDHGMKKQLPHHVRHSTEGLDWGKGAPVMDLSLSLLLDAFGVRECPSAPEECQCFDKWVEPTYQAFEQAVLSKFSKDEDWSYSQLEAVDWVFDHIAHGSPLESLGKTPLKV